MSAVAAGRAADAELRSIAREILLPNEGVGGGLGGKLPVDLWADRYRRLVVKRSNRSGPWRTETTPYLRRPMRMFSHPAVRRITLMFGPQLGKTEAITNCQLWALCNDPGPTMVVYANKDDARLANEERFLPSVRECEPAARHLTAAAWDTKKEKIEFDNCTFWFFGTNSKSGLRQRAIRYLFPDEIETYTEPTQGHRGPRHKGATNPGWTQVYDRVLTFPDHKILESSTPGDENAGIDAIYQQGDREQFWVPCPRGGCGEYQVLVFAGVRWDGGVEGDLGEAMERAKATARYECRACHAAIWNDEKPAMLSRGVWAPEGMTGAEMLDLADGDPLKAVDLLPREHMSLQLRPANSPFGAATWGDIAAQFVKRRGRVDPVYVQSWMGEPWKAIGDRLEDAEVKALCVPADRGGYRAGFVPEGVLALTLAADVQKDRIYFTVRGWGETGRDTWLIDRRCIPRREGDELIHLDPFLGETYGRWGGGGGERLRIGASAIDSGHFTMEVYKAVRRMNAAGVPVFAFKGEDTGSQLKPHHLTLIDKAPDGKPLPWTVWLIVAKSNTWKSDLLARIRGRAGLIEGWEGTGAEHEKAAEIIGGFYLPEDAGEDYLRQMQSEHRAAPVAPGGRVAYTWVKKPGHPDNHYWDCEYMQLALADIRDVRLLRKSEPQQAAATGEAAPRARSGWMEGVKARW